MKKIIYSVLALASMVLSFVSCVNDDALTESVQVTFTAKIPESTHARSEVLFGTGDCVDRLYSAIYEKTDEGTYRFVLHGVVERKDAGFSYSPYLTKGRTYKIAFWAMQEGKYQILDNLKKINIPPMMQCNDPSMEAFAGVSGEVSVGNHSGSPIDVKLSRPFAMLNFATTMNDAQKEQIESMEAEVSVTCTGGMATSYNVFDNKVTYDPSRTTLSFSKAKILGGECEKDGVKYIRLASCFVIPPADEDGKVKVQIQVTKDETTMGNLTEPDIPLTVNFSTNLYGKMLTVN